jgi:hypothetical protein
MFRIADAAIPGLVPRLARDSVVTASSSATLSVVR